MLAIVLSGIALGGFAGSRWLARDPHAGRHAFWVALFAAAAGATGYHLMGLGLVDPDHPRVVIDSLPGLVIALSLMFPISLASGLLFTLLGNALNDALHVPVRSAGLLTLVNTLGAATGPLVAGFFLVLSFYRSLFPRSPSPAQPSCYPGQVEQLLIHKVGEFGALVVAH